MNVRLTGTRQFFSILASISFGRSPPPLSRHPFESGKSLKNRNLDRVGLGCMLKAADRRNIPIAMNCDRFTLIEDPPGQR